MNFVEAIQSGFRKYVGFAGRARRSEFWWFVLFYVIAAVIGAMIDGATRSVVTGLIVTLAFALPNLALQIRRLHDVDRSGWWIFIGVIPLVGTILLIVWWCQDGVAGENRYGPDPKRPGPDASVFDASPPPSAAAA